MGISDQEQLQYALEEAQTVATLLGTVSYLNNQATTSVLIQSAQTSVVIHLAAHGMFRLDAPNFSYIQLADRQLSATEVFNLNLVHCSLIVLSACETGRAIIGGIDEMIGLGRGFLYAGTASILPTYWKIDDASACGLMETFYRALLEHRGKAASLCAAQRSFLLHARESAQAYRIHPYYWAAYHLIGDPGRVF
jgi:CHAT domain-containing protein